MNSLQLLKENNKLKKENQVLKQTIMILQDIIKTEDDCINELVSHTINDAKRLVYGQKVKFN